MKDIKIVTGFFDIDRENFTLSFQQRSVETYFNYFKFWARIQNDLIIYCEPKYVSRIKKIREDFNRFNTTVIPIENIYNIEPDLYKGMCKVENSSSYQNMRQRKAIENTAKYDYVTFLKFWCIKDASLRIQEDCTIAWIDFGYNHGGNGENGSYIDEQDFDFYWEYPFEDKIYITCCRDPNTISVVESLYKLTDHFEGGVMVCPKDLCPLFYEKIKRAVETLLEIDCIDDDQLLDLVVYKQNPELFHITLAPWFTEFDIYTDREFKRRLYKEENPNLISF